MSTLDSWSGGASPLRRWSYRLVDVGGEIRLECRQEGCEDWQLCPPSHRAARAYAALRVTELVREEKLAKRRAR